MDKEVIIEKLSVLQKDVRQLFWDDCSGNSSVPIEDMLIKIEPYSILDNAFKKAIEKVKQRNY